ncbi:histidine phosphatase family protein [Xenophilus arseniciresistens]|uniref:Histidine phosphatase family protein n=1 Tax=Xenophilus arseniciresistens TaxID=1283306 RepID=A0AAE3SZ58_9BURK|nr:histidine phosphatase family protein [Xenophilus arseniciresistens]MDA7416807.1 histidine phosphatase family protein [Xenophilus arseniciresistens]
MTTSSSSAPTDLILIRHGETDWNRELRFQGHIDVPLNDMGHEQARRLGLRMKGEQVHHIICSDLMRTQQTTAPAAQQLGLPVQTTVTLREQNFGVVEGMRAEEIQAHHPRAWEEWLQFKADRGMPGGESTREFHARAMAALSSIAREHAGRTVLVVTHGGFLDMVWRTAHALGLDGPRQSDIPNAGINRIRIADAQQPQALQILDWADTAHLLGLAPQPTYDQRRHLAKDAR